MASTGNARPPIPVLVVVGASLLVLAVLLFQAAVSVFIRLIQFGLILAAFAAMAGIGLYLLRKGDLGSDD